MKRKPNITNNPLSPAKQMPCYDFFHHPDGPFLDVHVRLHALNIIGFARMHRKDFGKNETVSLSIRFIGMEANAGYDACCEIVSHLLKNLSSFSSVGYKLIDAVTTRDAANKVSIQIIFGNSTN